MRSISKKIIKGFNDIFCLSRRECSCVRGSTHRKAHSNQHSLDRRTLAVDFAPLLKHKSPYVETYAPVSVFGLLSPLLHELLRPCFCLCSLIALLLFNLFPYFLLASSPPPFLKIQRATPLFLAVLIPILLRILIPSLLIPHSREYYAPVFVHALLIPLVLRNLRPC